MNPALRRILLALESAEASEASMEAVAAFARQASAELDALFVEDADLMRAAQLPFTTQVSRTSAQRIPLDPQTLEVQMRRLANAARERLSRAAGRHAVKWTFRTVRGSVGQELSLAAEHADLIVFEGAPHRAPAQRRAGLRTLAAVRAVTSRSVLLLRTHQAVQGRPLVVYDGTVEGGRALSLGLAMRTAGQPLRVVLTSPGDAGSHSAGLEAAARSILGEAGADAEFETIQTLTAAALCRRAAETGSVVVLVPARCGCAAAELESLVEQVPCSLLLIR